MKEKECEIKTYNRKDELIFHGMKEGRKSKERLRKSSLFIYLKKIFFNVYSFFETERDRA